jgi:Zn-dependent protease with chaperone function
MQRRWLALTPILIAVPVCSAWTETCEQGGPCSAAITQPHMWAMISVAGALLVGILTILMWSVRTLWLVRSCGCEVNRLHQRSMPIALEQALWRTGAQAVECLAADELVAFCAGALRPHIFVSFGLVTSLRPDELDAVLLHEQHHRRRRDPLRNAARRAAADVCFYAPLVQWWARHQHENAELRADLAAVQGTGRRSLAGALWVAGTGPAPRGSAAFGGLTELRTRQVLGDPLPRRVPKGSEWLMSALGLTLCLGLASCLTQVLIALD